MMNFELTEMQKLMVGLDLLGVSYEVKRQAIFNADQIYCENENGFIFDVVCHSYSYGGKDGLLEIMGLDLEETTGNSVKGFLNAKECLELILDYLVKENIKFGVDE